MAYNLSQRTKNALSRENIQPNLVLSIDGVETKYAVRIAQQIIKYDIPGLTYDSGLSYDQLIPTEGQEDLISLSGTTTTISQQLEPDKGAASSTQTLTLSLIDRNEQITRLASPGVVIDDVLYTDAELFFGLYDTSFPEDYIKIFNGKIMGINPKVGTVDFIVTHPEDLNRSSIFEKADVKLTQVAHFSSATIQSLFYQKRADVIGNVTVTYTSAGIGDDAIVSVTGNDITVQIDTSFTTAKTIKKKIENNEDANQLVSIKITGTPTQIQTTQATTLLSSSTEIFVDDVSDFFLPLASPLFKTYLRINDEIIQYTGIDTVANKFTGCTRQSLTSFGATHSIGDTVSSFYKYGDASFDYGNSPDLALYLLLSGADPVYLETTSTSIVGVDGIGLVQNAIFFSNQFLVRDQGVIAGDLISSNGSLIANTFTDRTILSVQDVETGSYVVVDGADLVYDDVNTYTVSFKSQYNILPDGAGCLPKQVDIAQFLKIKNTYASQISLNEFYFKDTITTKDFINQKIFLPSAMYSVPRKGKISCGITSPPLYDANSKNLTINNVKDPKGLKLERSVNKNFYNAVGYKYNPDSVDDKFLNKVVTVSADSSNRIGAPSRVFVIEADGLRPSAETSALIKRNSNSFLNRYKYGAEQIKVKVLFKDGFGMEVGDSELFGDSEFQMSDTTKGSRNFSPRIMEITNKEWNWKTSETYITLLDTTYSSNVRVGTFSPSSIVGVGSTTTEIIVTKSFGTTAIQKEKDKYENYIGREILVHSEDWSVQGYTYIRDFDPSNDNKMRVSPALGFSPSAGYIIDVVPYNQVDTLESFYKNVHDFWGHQVAVVSGASSTQLDVSALDIGKFFVGCFIQIHNADYSIDSGVNGLKVSYITGNTLTFDDAGFTPDNTMVIDLIGFSEDKGKPYVWL